MSRSNKLSGVLVCVSLVAGEALACGPDFPFEYLSRRDETLASLPDAKFLVEVGRLVEAPAKPFALEPDAALEARAGEAERRLFVLASKGSVNEARAAYTKLLALPVSERGTYTVAALLGLGGLGDTPRYAELRTLVHDGAFADPTCAAVFSLGEEALVALNAGDDVSAVQLYAEQAAHGSVSGSVSLLLVARRLVADPARLTRALASPLVQRLVTTYLWTRSREGVLDGPAVEQLLSQMMQRPTCAGADRLAAALFRAGRFEDAQVFAVKEDTPLAHWVRAKLLARSGERAGADRELEQAAAGFSLVESWSNEYEPQLRPRRQIELERAILALARDEFDAALAHAASGCSWEDLAYLAERVVETPVLKRYVESGMTELRACQNLVEYDGEYGWLKGGFQEALRHVLGRRLLREGKGEQALAFFDASTRDVARRYWSELERSEKGSKLERAKALAKAAVLVRAHGMELMGFEGEPDFVSNEGLYVPREAFSADAGLRAEEWRRYRATAPKFATRFHYRAVASQLAEESANLLSRRSQAFTAMLCRAAQYDHSGESKGASQPGRFEALYRRAVKEGPLLTEPMEFGYRCPQPRFVEAAVRHRAFRWPFRKRWLALGIGALVVLVVAWRTRKHVTPPVG